MVLAVMLMENVDASLIVTVVVVNPDVVEMHVIMLVNVDGGSD